MNPADGERARCLAVDLTKRTAIVTGAGGEGVGRLGVQFAQALAAAGAAVVAADIDGDAAEATARDLRSQGHQAVGVRADVTRDGDADRMVAIAEEAFGFVDILVNNAGLARGRWSLGLDLSTEDWMQILAVNTVAPLVCARACRPSMVAAGGGSIVNITSMGAYLEAGAYSVSKAALASMNNVLAAELGGNGIRVNAIAPGMMTAQLPPDQVEQLLAGQKVRRQGDPSDLLGALLYLCSDSASFVTGTTIRVDGGMVRGHI